MPSSISCNTTDDIEISFRKGVRIIQVECVMEDWWKGTLADGRRGLFLGESLSKSPSSR